MPERLTIAQFAERTGVSAETVRAWELRHGFPRPERDQGGRRRYAVADAERVADVVRLRATGLSLTAAIARVHDRDASAPTSVYAGLRALRPELAPATVSKRSLLALSHAIEDEWLARGGGGVLVGSFQRERFFRQAEPRWIELARRADVAVAIADFPRLRTRRSRAVEVPAPRDHAIAREWTLVAVSPGAVGCLAAWEPPAARSRTDGERAFEMVWSAEAGVAQTAAVIAADVIGPSAPAVAEQLRARASAAGDGAATNLRAATALTSRMIGYLAAR